MSSEMYCKKIIRHNLPVLCLLSAQSVSAKCGGVDYSWGADALALMVLTAMAVARVTATAFFCLRSLIK